MAFPASHMRFRHISFRFLAKGRQLHAALENGGDGSAHRGIQA